MKRFRKRSRTTSRTAALKEAIVATFILPGDEAAERIGGFSDDDWKSVLWWLDISGMAIYFLHRMGQSGAAHVIPAWVREDLARRLANNRIRIKALQQEARVLTGWFESGYVPYAVLKGISLTPDSVPDGTLRCQTDLDLLVPQRSKDLVIHYISRLGYRLHATNANTLEFRAGAASLPDLENMYSVHTQRALELHLEPDDRSGLLARRVTRLLDGSNIDTLAPADIFVQQALHLLKHLCGEHTRLSWVLEFWRHGNTRAADAEFWREVEMRASEQLNGNLAMAIAFYTAKEFFGAPTVNIPPQWRSETLAPRVRLWLDRYTRELLLGDSLGSKVYAFLRNEIPSKDGPSRATRQILLPYYLPARITHRNAHETLGERLRRYEIELDVFLCRLRFHLMEGIRFVFEAARWRRATVRCER